MATLRQALEYAAQNPNSEFAKFLTQRIQSGEADTEARQAGIDLTPIKRLAPQPEPKEPGYFSRVGGSLAETGKETLEDITQLGGESIQEFQKPQESLFGGLLKGTGSALRAGLRTAGGVARSVFTPILEAPVVKPALEKVGQAITKIPGAEPTIQKLSEWSVKYPEAAKDIENIIDITALTGLPAVTKPVGAVTGEVATKAGRVLEESGLQAAKVAKESFAKELIMPLQTAAIKTKQVGRTSEIGKGIFKRSVIEPDFFEKRAIAEISNIPEVSASKTFQQNYNIIKEYNVGLAKQLEDGINANNFIVSKKEILANLNRASANLSDNPVIVGDAQKTASKLITGAKKIIEKNEGTGAGLLKARKEYDSWVLSQKPKAFDATAENAFSVANREIRQAMNDLLDAKAPDVGVKDSLRKQSALYDAMENIKPKAAKEADTAIMRAMDRVGAVLGVKNRLVQGVAAAVGIGGLGAASTFAPAVAVLGGAGFLTFKAGELVLKPEVRIAIGKLLQEAGHLLNPEDKKILENAIKTYQEIPNKEGGFISLGGGKEIESLIAQARKYKSAEEFVSNIRGSATQYGEYKPQFRQYGMEDYKNISELGVKPDEMVTIYRGIDTTTGKIKKTINDGDFVTTDYDSALSYTGDAKRVVSMEVPAKTLYTDAIKDFTDDPFYKGAEYVYTKQKVNPMTKSQLTDIWNKAHGN